MHVAVEDAPADRGEKPAPHALLDQWPWIDAQLRDAREIVDRDAVEELHGEHTRAGEFQVGLGHDHERQVDALQELAVVHHGARLVAEVELLRHLLAEAVERAHELAGRRNAHLA